MPPEYQTSTEEDLHPVLAAFKKRPYIYSFIVGALALTLMRPCLVVEAEKPTLGPQLDDFEFIDHNGTPFRPSALRGKVWIAGFFDPHGPLADSATFKAMKDLEKRYIESSLDASLVLLSVALKDNTQAVLDRIVREEQLDTQRWFLLRPPNADTLREVAVHTFRSQYDPGFERPAKYSDRLWIIDRQGRVRGHPRQGRDNFKTTVRNYDDIYEWSRVVMKESTPP